MSRTKDNEKTIVYSFFNTLAEAYEARSILEMCDIPCFITNETLATVYPMFDSNLGGIRLHIFEKDLARANEALHQSQSE